MGYICGWWRRQFSIGDARRVLERHFALRLAFVLEPYGYRLYFPVENECQAREQHVGSQELSRVTYIPAAFARASRSSRVGCDVLWNNCSSIMS
jgi:hypothetical protein